MSTGPSATETAAQFVPWTIRGLIGSHRLAALVIAAVCAGTVAIFLGSRDGSFTKEGSLSVPSDVTLLAAADFNGDGKVDLAAVGPDPQGTVTIFFGSGDGTFQNKGEFTVGSMPQTVTAADLNGDGRSDLVFANQSSSTVSVFLSGGDGTDSQIDPLLGGEVTKIDGDSFLAANP